MNGGPSQTAGRQNLLVVSIWETVSQDFFGEDEEEKKERRNKSLLKESSPEERRR